MATMHVELVSIEAPIWSGEASAVFGRTTDGELGILPGHTPLLGALEPGYPVRIQQEGGDELRVAISGGFLSVHQDGQVAVLAEEAMLADDVDAGRAREDLNRSEGEDGPEAESARLWAISRLRAAGEQV
jgi:F-type H+-transporting ATPase subunit epsilon